jgi:DNA-binding Xre family transcriptional regulator
MLYFNFTRIFKAKGIERPASFLTKNGFSDNFATKVIKNSLRKFELDTVERLCTVFHCTPNDLLQWEPNSKEVDVASHPLSPLYRTEKVMDLTRTLYAVPFEKLLEIEKIIQQEIDKKP